jgi:hypothetical protein
VKRLRDGKDFLCFDGARPVYVRYDEHGTRHTSRHPSGSTRAGALANPRAVNYLSIASMAFLALANWLGDEVFDCAFDDLRSALMGNRDIVALPVIDECLRPLVRPRPYHQLQVCFVDGAVCIWVTLSGHRVYPVIIPARTSRAGHGWLVVMDLRGHGPEFHSIPAGNHPVWRLGWEEQLDAELAASRP